MNITLGVFDLFAYAVPGALYLGLLTYITERLAWIDPLRILQANTTVVVIAAAMLSFLIGHITSPLGHLLSRVYGRDKSAEDAAREFVERVPTAQGRPFLQADRSLLQAAAEVHGMEAAIEISRLRALGLMLRNCAPVFVLGAVTEVADAAAGAHPIVAGCCVVIFPLVAIGCLNRSAIWRHWTNMKTLELAYWTPDIDDNLLRTAPAKQSGHRDQSSSRQGARSPTTSTPRRSKRSSSQPPGSPK